MTARDDILAAIRQGLTHGSEGALPRRTPSEIASEAAALLANPAEIRPALAGPDPVAAFIAKCANPRAWGDAGPGGGMGRAACRRRGLSGPPRPCPPDRGQRRRAAGRADAGRHRNPHPGTAPDEAAAISVARWGIAETRIRRDPFGARSTDP